MERHQFYSRAIFVSGILILVSGLAFRHLQPLAASRSGRGVSIVPDRIDFGKVTQSQELVKEFRVVNDTSHPIQIQQVMSSCGCTTTDPVVDRVVAGHSSLALRAVMKTGAAEGYKSGTITIFFTGEGSGPNRPEAVECKLTSLIAPDYTIAPAVLDFGKIDHVGEVKRTVSLHPAMLDTAKVTGVGCGHPAFTVSRAGSGEVEVRFSGKSLTKSEMINASIFLHTNSPNVPTSVVLARADFRAPIEVEPASIVLGRESRGLVERMIRIKGSRPVTVTGLHADDRRIRVACPDGNAALEHRLELKIEEPASRPISARVVVELVARGASGDAAPRVLTIPVHRFSPSRPTGARGRAGPGLATYAGGGPAPKR